MEHWEGEAQKRARPKKNSRATVLLLLYSSTIYRSHWAPFTTLNISLTHKLVVLDLQLKHDHALLRLGDVLHPLVVGPALNVDELARAVPLGTDLHSHQR